MFKRALFNELLDWKNRKTRLPLIIRGARQVGKTSLIRAFGESDFHTFVEINFESDKNFKSCFDTLDPTRIISNIEKLSNKKIAAGNTLLFFDEIQECIDAISALRYFKEKMPELHVIAAGSLLEFALESKQLKMPVGRVEFLYLYPLSFDEFLQTQNKSAWLDILNNASLNNTKDLSLIHDSLLEAFHDYLIVGGMPDAVREFTDTHSYHDVQRIQNHILLTYENDFSKYATSKADEGYIQLIYEKIPAIVSQPFKYSKIIPDVQSRSLAPALTKLVKAQVLQKVYATTASGLPLKSLINEKKFKVLMSDVGLYCAATNLSKETLLANDIIVVNKGTLAEQVVGQELIANSIAYKPSQLTYWLRDENASRAKVDYVIQHNHEIIPIEVKSGSAGRLKSLHIFMQSKGSHIGIKISQAPLSFEKNILSVPIYLLKHLDRLIGVAS